MKRKLFIISTIFIMIFTSFSFAIDSSFYPKEIISYPNKFKAILDGSSVYYGGYGDFYMVGGTIFTSNNSFTYYDKWGNVISANAGSGYNFDSVEYSTVDIYTDSTLETVFFSAPVPMILLTLEQVMAMIPV